MSKIYLYLITLFFVALIPYHSSLAFEVTIVDTGPSVNSGRSIKIVEPVYPMATANDIACGKSHHMVRFSLNNKHAGLPFSVTAKKMTKIKIRWDHEDKVFFPASDSKKTVVFPHAGGESRLYFRAYQPISGNVYIMNDANVVVQTCPYSFLPAKHYRQSINMSLNETNYDGLGDAADSTDSNISINYSIGAINPVPGGGLWTVTGGVSQSESSRDSQRITGSFRYSW